MNLCTFVLEFGLLATATPSAELLGDDPLFSASARCERGNWVALYRHESSLSDGPPFNHRRDERWQEAVGVFYRVVF